MKENLRIVFMGTPEFAKKSLEKLVNLKYNVVGVFTNPDKPSGRGMKLNESEVKKYAIANNIRVFQPVKLRNNEEVINILNDLKPDLIVVVAYGKILPKEILYFPKYGSVNVHGSLLPDYRGAAPMQWAIINGEPKTGITTMFMNEGMDTGDMLLKEEVEITDEDDFESVHDKMKEVGANLLVETIDKIIDGSIKRVKQPEEGTLAPMISREMTKIDFNKNGREIFNFVRGLSPFPGTYIQTEDDRKFKIFKVLYEEVDNLDNDLSNGEVVECTKKTLKIKCQNGYISILNIQPPNSKRMDILSFLAGNKLEVGTKFI